MFRNLAALIASGVLLNPVVLFGVVLGLIIGVKLDFEQIVALYRNWHFYGLGLMAAVLYNFALATQYKDDGDTLDYAGMVKNSIKSFMMFVLAVAMAVLFVAFFWI